jgi:O-antigen ligase
MKAQIKALIVQLLPNVELIPYILFALIPLTFIYFLASSKKFQASMVAQLIVIQLMTPIAYYQIADIRGMQPVYLWWLATLIVVFLSRISSGKPLNFGKFFKFPIILLLIATFVAWINTFTASSQHAFYQAGFSRSTLFWGSLLTPIQIMLTAWMVMLVTEEEQDMAVIQKALMAAAIIFGVLITAIYLKLGAQSGSSQALFAGRFAINDIMGEENNGLAAIGVFLFIACVCMRSHGGRLLKAVSIGAILSGILFTLSRMAWLAAALVALLLLPKEKWLIRIMIILVFIGLYLHSHTIIINRLYYGTEKTYSSKIEQLDNISANRVTIWKAAWAKIQENPIIGTGIQTAVRLPGGEIANHPHNAYLRTLLDMGIIGLVPVFIAYGYMLIISYQKSGLLFFSIISLFIMGFVCLEFHPHKQNYLIWLFYAITLNEPGRTKLPLGADGA